MSLNINQRDVFLLPFVFDNDIEDHLYIVLSIKEANDCESTLIGVMVTSSSFFKDDYSFELTDDMFEEPLKKEGCHVRMHLITLMVQADIMGKRKNRMKSHSFQQLMKSIGELVFNYRFTPIT